MVERRVLRVVVDDNKALKSVLLWGGGELEGGEGEVGDCEREVRGCEGGGWRKEVRVGKDWEGREMKLGEEEEIGREKVVGERLGRRSWRKKKLKRRRMVVEDE